jgi:hypothetical protein
VEKVQTAHMLLTLLRSAINCSVNDYSNTEDILKAIYAPEATVNIESLSNGLEALLAQAETSAIFAIIDRATGKAEALRSELKKVSQ